MTKKHFYYHILNHFYWLINFIFITSITLFSILFFVNQIRDDWYKNNGIEWWSFLLIIYSIGLTFGVITYTHNLLFNSKNLDSQIKKIKILSIISFSYYHFYFLKKIETWKNENIKLSEIFLFIPAKKIINIDKLRLKFWKYFSTFCMVILSLSLMVLFNRLFQIIKDVTILDYIFISIFIWMISSYILNKFVISCNNDYITKNKTLLIMLSLLLMNFHTIFLIHKISKNTITLNS